MQPVAIFLACAGALTLLVGLSRSLAGRRWASAGHVALAVCLILVASQLWPVAANLGTYQALHRQRPVAQVFCERTGSRSHRLTLTRLPGGRMQVFEVAGDQWRLDARTLQWQGWAVDLGLEPRVRLEHLSTRFLSPADAADAVPSSYALSEETGKDIWSAARAGSRWRHYVVTGQADGAWQPLAQGARFAVWVGAVGLQARPANDAAAAALQRRSSERPRDPVSR